MANDCSNQIVPSPNNPGQRTPQNPDAHPRKGDVLIFNFVPPIRFPCHEEVAVVSGADLQHQSGDSFQVKLTAQYAVVEVTIWCSALLPDESEGAKTCSTTRRLVLGDPSFINRYVDCFRKCWNGAFGNGPVLGVSMLTLAAGVGIIGLGAGAALGGPLGALAGAGAGGAVGVVALPIGAAAVCGVKCFFESL